MTSTPPRAAKEAAPPLPGRALLIAPTVERAATLSMAFDEVRAATLDEFAAILVADGAGLPCVAVTGVPARGGRLAVLVEEVLRHCTSRVQFVLDPSEPVRTDLLADGPQVLRGLSLVDRVDLGGVPCLRFLPSCDPSDSPDPERLRDTLASLLERPERLGHAVRSLIAPGQADRLQARIDELEAQLAVAGEKLSATSAELSRSRTANKSALEMMDRLRKSPLGRSALVLDRARQRGLRELRADPRARQLVRKAAVVTVGAAILTADGVVVALIVGGHDGAVLTILVVLSLAELLNTWRCHRRVASLDGRVAKADRSRTAQGRKDAAIADRRQRKLEEMISALTTQAQSLERNLAVVTASTVDTAHAVAGLLERTPTAPVRDPLQDLHQTQAIANLFAMLPVDDVVPLMGGWAASPDVVLLLVEELRARGPRCVVECGSGVSTLWMALAVKKYGLDTRIVALEHEPGFAETTRRILVRHGVADIAEVRDAPLLSTGLAGHEAPWYDPAVIADLDDIGLLFVDGPPTATGPHARYPAIPLLAERLAPRATVVLDDLVRDDEREVTAIWEGMLPEFDLERLPLAKGAAVFRRG